MRYIKDNVKVFVRERDNGQCVYCNRKEYWFGLLERRPMEYGHVIPHSKGGDTCTNNIQLECFECNRSKGNKKKKQPRHKLLFWKKKGAKGCRKNCKEKVKK